MEPLATKHTHLFEVRARAPLTFQCIVWGSGGQLAPQVGLACSCSASWPSHTRSRKLGGDPWPHQMPYSRVQLMLHIVQTNSTFYITQLGLDVIATTFIPAEWAPPVYNCVFPVYMPWSPQQPWWQPSHRLEAFCKEFQVDRLSGCDSEQMVTFNNPLLPVQTKAASVGTLGLN